MNYEPEITAFRSDWMLTLITILLCQSLAHTGGHTSLLRHWVMLASHARFSTCWRSVLPLCQLMSTLR